MLIDIAGNRLEALVQALVSNEPVEVIEVRLPSDELRAVALQFGDPRLPVGGGSGLELV